MILEPDDVYNRQLKVNARPGGYVNPAPAPNYNMVVVGAGPAGLVVAAAAAGLGGKVALVERHLMGGDCLNSGCVPSKALIRAARSAHESKKLTGISVSEIPPPSNYSSPPSHFSPPPSHFSVAMERMRRLRAEISAADSVKRFTDLGVDVFIGTGRFTGVDTIDVDGKQLRFARAAITTGSSAAIPEIPGLAEAGFETHTTLFNLTVLPRRLVVIGGGPIGCEMAQAFQRLGSQVTLLQSGPRLLPKDDAEASAVIKSCFESEGITVCLNAKIIRVARGTNEERHVSFESDGRAGFASCERILVATGRVAELASLDLKTAGVRFEDHGISVNDYLQTSNPRIYAAGDVCTRFKFTHAADAMARILVRNALFFGSERANRLIIPWTTYTDPEVAQVGLTVEETKLHGISADILTVPMRDVDRAVLDGESDGFGRLILARGTDTILGATLVASHAGDMISEVVLAMTNKLGASKLSATIHPYPTQAEVWRKLGDAYNKTRLSPRIKSLLTRLLRWRRGG